MRSFLCSQSSQSKTDINLSEKPHTSFLFHEWNVNLSGTALQKLKLGYHLMYFPLLYRGTNCFIVIYQKKFRLFLGFSVWYIGLTSTVLQVWHFALLPVFSIHCSELFTHHSFVFPIRLIFFLFFPTWIVWIEGSSSAFIITSQHFQYVPLLNKISRQI